MSKKTTVETTTDTDVTPATGDDTPTPNVTNEVAATATGPDLTPDAQVDTKKVGDVEVPVTYDTTELPNADNIKPTATVSGQFELAPPSFGNSDSIDEYNKRNEEVASMEHPANAYSDALMKGDIHDPVARAGR